MSDTWINGMIYARIWPVPRPPCPVSFPPFLVRVTPVQRLGGRDGGAATEHCAAPNAIVCPTVTPHRAALTSTVDLRILGFGCPSVSAGSRARTKSRPTSTWKEPFSKGSMRFSRCRLVRRTYDAPSWGVRVVNLTKSRKLTPFSFYRSFFFSQVYARQGLQGRRVLLQALHHRQRPVPVPVCQPQHEPANLRESTRFPPRPR